MRWAMSSVACVVSRASSLTSPATTANPLPASPARAASMVALRARRLVCSEMTATDFNTSPMRSLERSSSDTVPAAAWALSTASCTMLWALVAKVEISRIATLSSLPAVASESTPCETSSAEVDGSCARVEESPAASRSDEATRSSSAEDSSRRSATTLTCVIAGSTASRAVLREAPIAVISSSPCSSTRSSRCPSCSPWSTTSMRASDPMIVRTVHTSRPMVRAPTKRTSARVRITARVDAAARSRASCWTAASPCRSRSRSAS